MVCDDTPAPILCIYHLIWPILSVMLGIVAGLVTSLLTTTIIFLLTLVRTPIHIWKIMYVTATTKECFKGYFSFTMRILVLILAPFPHLLWLISITVFSGTIGTLYYVGKCTRIIYNHEYSETSEKVKSNVNLEPTSHVGKYLKRCHEYMEDDKKSYPVVYFLKGCVASVFGTLLGVLPMIPFSFAMVGISLLRLPINLFKTMKIALVTRALKLDLKLLALIILPCAHIIFPIVVSFLALFKSLVYFPYRTSKNIHKGSNPFKKWDWFQDSLVNYYKAHQHFVGERCNNYDHPIPWGWNGHRYGVPVTLILRWQWKFLFCCFLVLYSITICFLGSSIICSVRILPCMLDTLAQFIKSYCKKSSIVMMGTWPFFVAGLLFAPLGAALLLTMTVALATLIMPFFLPPRSFLMYGHTYGLLGPFEILSLIDKHTGACFTSGDWKVFSCLENYAFQPQPPGHVHSGEHTSRGSNTEQQYWDKFIAQCIKTTSELIEAKWITTEDVQAMVPAVVISIPTIAVFQILIDSAVEEGLEKEDIKWSIDESICKEKDRPTHDAIYIFFWPLICNMKKTVSSNNKLLTDTAYVKVIMAMICDNGEDCTEELKEFLNSNEKMSIATHNVLLRTKLINFVLEISRVRPYLDRMNKIFTHSYETNTEKITCGR